MKKTKEKTKKHGDDAPALPDATATDAACGVPDEASTAPDDPVAALEQRVALLEDALLRAKADYQNLQRRSIAQQTDAVRYANAEVMKSLISVVDDFDRAMVANETGASAADVKAGMKLVHENLTKALRDHGLECVPALHEPFDPSVHEALLQQPTDEHEPGTVVDEVAKGYRLRDRVIRPAKVVVSKAKEGGSPDRETGGGGA